jgi:hypothetical protein
MNAGLEYFQRIATFSPKIADSWTILTITMLGTLAASADADQSARIAKNGAYSAHYDLGTVAMGQYFAEDFSTWLPLTSPLGRR